MGKGLLIFAVLSTVVSLAVAGVLIVVLRDDARPAGKAPRQLAAAIQANEPSAAPGMTADYVKGVRRYFGPVRSARALETYTRRTETSSNNGQYTTSPVAEILLRAKRGAAVIELDLDDDKITDIDEVEPDDVHARLGKKTAAAVKRGFANRGGKPGRPLVLDGTFTEEELDRN